LKRKAFAATGSSIMRVLAVIAAFALAACATAPAPQNTSVDAATAATLDAANTAFSAAFMRGDVETILAAYTPDALVQTPEGGVSTSAESLRALWEPVRTSGPTSTHRLQATHRQRLEGGVVMEAGSFEITRRTDAGEQRSSRGCYTLLWRETPAGWRILYDTWTPRRDPGPTCAPS
jgi:ketosteroid isomerase-like protein